MRLFSVFNPFFSVFNSVNMDQKPTEISELGEFGLIDRLTREFPLKN